MTSANSSAVTTCPICRKPQHDRYRPFCSKRCADVDLGRWMQGSYTLPGDAPAEGIGEDAGDGDRDHIPRT